MLNGLSKAAIDRAHEEAFLATLPPAERIKQDPYVVEKKLIDTASNGRPRDKQNAASALADVKHLPVDAVNALLEILDPQEKVSGQGKSILSKWIHKDGVSEMDVKYTALHSLKHLYTIEERRPAPGVSFARDLTESIVQGRALRTISRFISTRELGAQFDDPLLYTLVEMGVAERGNSVQCAMEMYISDSRLPLMRERGAWVLKNLAGIFQDYAANGPRREDFEAKLAGLDSAVPLLTKNLEGSTERVHLESMRALAAFGQRASSAENPLRVILDNGEVDLRIAAARTLGLVANPSPAIISRLQHLAQHSKHPFLRKESAFAAETLTALKERQTVG